MQPAKTGRFKPNDTYDVAIVGGGIHGMSMALEACKRGLSVILVQGNDLASGASGIQTGVFGGGFQALSQFNLSTVRSNFCSLKTWSTSAANTAKPSSALLYPNDAIRSERTVKAGLSIYHRFAGKPAVKYRGQAAAFPQPYFAYTLHPARQIINLACEAAALGADIYPYTRVNAAKRLKATWQLEVTSHRGNTPQTANVEAKMLVNCCGWLANAFLTDVLGVVSRAKAQARKAALLYVSGPFEAPPLPITLQAENKQFIHMLATCPQRYIVGPFDESEMALDENTVIANLRDLLTAHLGTASSQWVKTLHLDAIKWVNYAQVSDPSGGVHRADFLQDSILDLNNPSGGAPLLNIFGIDIVKHANLARQGLDILAPFSKSCASRVVMLKTQCEVPIQRFENPLFNRWQVTYGNGLQRLFDDAKINHNSETSELGIHFGEDLFQCEVDYLIRYEWATTAEDILWRRGDWGPWFPESGKQMLSDYLSRIPQNENVTLT